MANETYKFSLNAEDIDKKLNMIPDTWGEISDQKFSPQSENPQSGKAVAEAIETKPGEKTYFGGEIFNDYENNFAVSQYSTAMGTNTSAGIKGYNIYSVSMNDATNNRIYINILGYQDDFDYITYNNTNPEQSTIVSFQLNNCYNFAGRVNYTQFKDEGYNSRLIMIVTLTPEYNAQAVVNDFTSDGENVLWLPYYPAAGIVSIGDGAFATGNTTHANYQGAFAAGRNNTADGKYSFVAGKDNKVGHASAAFGTSNNVFGQCSFASGTGNEVKSIYSFAHGQGLVVNSAKKAVFGYFNLNEYADNSKYSIFTIGNGIDNTHRSNALDIYNDGSAELQTQGTSDNSIVINATLNNKPGQKTSDGGEKFNNYTDNVAVELAHAEGTETSAEGIASHAEGECTNATGYASHAEGMGTIAEGEASHAEGSGTVARGDYSHAGGSASLASEYAQFVHGENVKLSSQTTDGAAAFGRYNDENSSALFAIGNGNAEPSYEEISYGSDGITYANNQVYYNGQLVYYYVEQGDEYYIADEQTHAEGYYESDGYKLFIKHEDTRKNAFEVYEDGHAEVQTTNIDNDKSIVTMETLKKFLVVSATQPNASDYPEGALWIKPLN